MARCFNNNNKQQTTNNNKYELQTNSDRSVKTTTNFSFPSLPQTKGILCGREGKEKFVVVLTERLLFVSLPSTKLRFGEPQLSTIRRTKLMPATIRRTKLLKRVGVLLSSWHAGTPVPWRSDNHQLASLAFAPVQMTEGAGDVYGYKWHLV